MKILLRIHITYLALTKMKVSLLSLFIFIHIKYIYLKRRINF